MPFAVEATGRLGPAASSFVDKITRNNTMARSYFLSAMSACIALNNSRMYGDARHRLVVPAGD